MFSSFAAEDVTLLLKDISGMVTPMDTVSRERAIQSGVHYSSMLPIEYEPTPAYLDAYEDALQRYAKITADAVAAVAEKILRSRGEKVVLVSLARAGIPIGILIKHYLDRYHNLKVPHYALSIIRGIGIDHRAMEYLLAHHAPETIQFVDGWTGKGAITRQLEAAMHDYPGVSPGLAVLSDPACVAEHCGTHQDFLIASSCLNATVSGLISRTFLREDVIGPEDYHGALFYRNLLEFDRTYEFIRTVEAEIVFPAPILSEAAPASGAEEVRRIQEEFGIADVNLVKPSIGEATRVLLRRVPWKILVHSLDDYENLGHLYRLAQEKHVPIEEYPLQCYRACGLIRKMADT